MPMPLPQTGWVATASVSRSGYEPKYAIDGTNTTHWSAGVPPAAGQWFQVDMGSTKTFREITLDAGPSWAMDYCVSCDVKVSNDASTWTTIGMANGTAQVTTVTLTTPAMGRYIQVIMNSGATASTHWWSIAEFDVLD
jgi:glucosylceramidase